MAAPRPDVLVVSPYAGGHHAEYLRWIARGLAERGARVAVAAHPALFPDEPLDADRVRLMGLDRIEAAGSLWAAGRATGGVVREAVEAARAPRVFLPYLDHAQLALALGMRFRFPVRLSGVLLRATPHERPASPADRVRQGRKRALLRLAARNPHLGAVLALDPDAVGPLRRLGLDARFLPDPVVPPSPSRSAGEVREALGVEPGRRLLLLFGSLEERKGVLATLGALGPVPAAAARRLAVVVVGRADPAIRERLEAAVAEARRTGAQVLYHERFVPDAELDDLVTAADVVLAPYLGHVGSSGAVLRAAAAGTPVLATDAGMVGREVRCHRLGPTVDAADRGALAAALARTVEEPGAAFDPDGAAAYARDHGLDRFVDTICDALALDR
ncbi:glycosyltransferase [Rubrivirga sp.]|uniref:glycosyltransferase n=1 Tax=Rubrivirga sp. TaxID=1885344 RepID=UPI003B52C0FB